MSPPTTRPYDVRRLVAKGTAFDAFHAIARGCGRDDDTPEERALYLVHGYLMEVPHGGHRSWYGESPYGREAVDTVRALRLVGFPKLASICSRTLAVFPEGKPPESWSEVVALLRAPVAKEQLNGLDSEMYRLTGPNDAETCLRFVFANWAAFGGDPVRGPDVEATLARMAEAEARADRDAERRARAAGPVERTPEPGEVETYRLAFRRSGLLVLVGAAIVLVGAAAIGSSDGGWDGRSLLTALTTSVGVAILRAGLRASKYRLRFDPNGIHATGSASIAWSQVTGCQLLSFAGGSGFAVIAASGDEERRITVPAGLARYDGCFRAFLAMSRRHRSPWRSSPGGLA